MNKTTDKQAAKQLRQTPARSTAVYWLNEHETIVACHFKTMSDAHDDVDEVRWTDTDGQTMT